ncbi:cytochrome C biogenesis protein [Novimethylophilus kurashikiensis]|uniref:Cytochrome C biogenesis protein n=1 Tax=Novimethylophilus kurashikiensis TaxID=1825523 RepID=A0A2R5FCX6_9PROT|nr:mechanosensitive ion channel family protein [Novimethylophilus kurashikiensis]GBG14561.1 cytochrome C biogenesis protein [Novimethylophilus kurashikiensis]
MTPVPGHSSYSAVAHPQVESISWVEFLQAKLSIIPLDMMQTLGLAGILLLTAQASSWVVSRNQPIEVRRFWMVTFRNLAAFMFLVGVCVIWREQLHSVIVALGAATAGMLLVFREAFMSMLAFWLHVLKRTYGLGDFIEIDGVTGEVVDMTWQHILLAETGPGTLTYSGRVIQIPNHRLLHTPVFVDNLTGDYGAHVLQVHLPKGVDILKAEKLLMAAAVKHCEPYYADARLHMNELQRRNAIDTPSIEPKVRIKLVEEGFAILVLRIVTPFREKLKVEQLILRDFLAAADEDAWPRVHLRHHP